MTAENPPAYEITTLADIVEKIPADRIPVFMEEATGLLLGIAVARGGISDLIGAENPLTLGLPLRWIDDGKQDLSLGFKEIETAALTPAPATGDE